MVPVLVLEPSWASAPVLPVGWVSLLLGNLLSIGVGGIITVAWSYIHPANFDWDITRSINNKEDFTLTENTAPPLAYDDEKEKLDGEGEGFQGGAEPMRNTTHTTVEAQPTDMTKENEELQKAFRFAAIDEKRSSLFPYSSHHTSTPSRVLLPGSAFLLFGCLWVWVWLVSTQLGRLERV